VVFVAATGFTLVSALADDADIGAWDTDGLRAPTRVDEAGLSAEIAGKVKITANANAKIFLISNPFTLL
jgi:hypothetical protein